MLPLTQFQYIINDDEVQYTFSAPLINQAGDNLALPEINRIIRISIIDVDKLKIHGYVIGLYNHKTEIE